MPCGAAIDKDCARPELPKVRCEKLTSRMVMLGFPTKSASTMRSCCTLRGSKSAIQSQEYLPAEPSMLKFAAGRSASRSSRRTPLGEEVNSITASPWCAGSDIETRLRTCGELKVNTSSTRPPVQTKAVSRRPSSSRPISVVGDPTLETPILAESGTIAVSFSSGAVATPAF